MKDYSEYRRKMTAEGKEYQDFVSLECCKRGMPIIMFQSQKYQYANGENTNGYEIKFDGRYKETKNLYIEIAEKSHPNNPKFAPSGIFRKDNTWLYLIGDYAKLFIFTRKKLVELAANGYEMKETPTSQGFLLSNTDAEKYAAKIIDFEQPGLGEYVSGLK